MEWNRLGDNMTWLYIVGGIIIGVVIIVLLFLWVRKELRDWDIQ